MGRQKLITIIIIFVMVVSAIPFLRTEKHEDTFTLVYFHGEGCPFSANLKIFLQEIQQNYTINLIEYEVWKNQSNLALFNQLTEAYNKTPEGIPTVFIDESVFTGFSPTTKEMLNKEIKRCSNSTCINPLSKII